MCFLPVQPELRGLDFSQHQDVVTLLPPRTLRRSNFTATVSSKDILSAQIPMCGDGELQSGVDDARDDSARSRLFENESYMYPGLFRHRGFM